MRLKKLKELEIARLRAQQEKAKDLQAEKVGNKSGFNATRLQIYKSVILFFKCVFLWIWQDEIRARRSQAIEERKWRMKEKEKAVKKVLDNAMLRAARLEQVQNKEHCLAMEINKQKAMLERMQK